MSTPTHSFLKQAGRILNSGQARTLVLTGNIYDLFSLSENQQEDYVPLVSFLSASWNLPELILIAYELNGPIRFVRESDSDKVRDAWLRWRAGCDSNELAIKRMLAKGKEASELERVVLTYDDSLRGTINNPTLALELLRQMCLCSRTTINGEKLLKENLLILVEGADLILPDSPIHGLSDIDRQRISICHDWFSDPSFVNGGDSVVLIAESRSLLHHRIARLPQLLEVEIPAPDEAVRRHFIRWFNDRSPGEAKVRLWSTEEELSKFTAGLSLHALMQLLKGARHEKKTLNLDEVVAKVEEFIKSQLGEDIVEFKKPAHTFDDVIGFRRLKDFLKNELLPRFQASGSDAISGAAVCGPIGGGKTFVFEALAAELDMVVLVLKNIRSQWFGQTDVIFERLKRVLNALAKVLIFVDEADTQFGGVGADTHETERRLTGKLQAMMSDPQLRGRVFWLLVTARIHLLSPDLRRPGRVGDLIIPTLDPEGSDREEFLQWTVKPVLSEGLSADQLKQLDQATRGYSAASFASLRSELKAKGKRSGGKLSFDQILQLIADYLSPAIEETRRYQTLQALVNCTRRSLLPDPNVTQDGRQRWEEELRKLEAKGVK
ncbi:MAG: AAA family ATPase [Verrucomicrobia bacterium]|nr:AAA family ATPase [Verrucomicrobiota bacterium]